MTDDHPRMRALLLGCGSFESPDLPQLEAPRHDVERLQRTLCESGYGYVRPVEGGSHADAERELEGFLKQSGGTVNLIYLSTHGQLDDRGDLYFAFEDTDKGRLDTTAVSAAWLWRKIDDSRARAIVVLLDCCYSGAFIERRPGHAGSREVAVLTSSDARSLSFEDGEFSHLTDGVLATLEGGAGRITFSDLYTGVYDHVGARGVAQCPGRFQVGEGPMVVAERTAVRRPDGARLPGQVLTHEDRLQRYARDMDVGYLKPGSSHPANPARLWHDLRPRDDKVTLLVGRAGAGKTRACIEVGELARQDGWRVLHVAAGADLTHRDLDECVRDDPAARTLLILDQVDGLHRIDPWQFLCRAEPEVNRRGGALRVLASTRRGLAKEVMKGNPPDAYHRVDLRDDPAHRRKLAVHLFRKVAPKAYEIIETDDLLRLCGDRPVFARLLARDQESRHRPDEEQPLDQGRDELLTWLRKRLWENELLPDEPAERRVLASALAAAVCPAPRAEVTAAVLPLAGPGPNAEAWTVDIVDQLDRMDWLEFYDGQYRVVHDMVADELLRAVLMPDGDRLIREALDKLLDCVARRPRALERFAGVLARLHAELDAESVAADDITEICRTWVAGRATGLDPVRSAFSATAPTLSTMLHTRLWQGPLIDNWAALVAPILADSAASGSGDLAAVLRRPNAPEAVVDSTLIWLSRHSEDEDAVEVLEPLLRHTGLTAQQREAAWLHALRWLRAAKVPGDAPPLLRQLLERRTASPALNRDVVDAAIAWLAVNGETSTADLAIRPLLSHIKLSSRETSSVIWVARRWLTGFVAARKASHLLKQLVVRYRRLGPEHQAATLDMVWRWLERHGRKPEASFLLAPLLAQRLPSAQVLATALRFTDDWFAANPGSEHVSFVLRRLLSIKNLPADRLTGYLRQALDWLGRQGPGADQSYVLRHMIARCERRPGPPGQLVDEVHARALAWLAAGDGGAGYVLSSLLASRRLDPAACAGLEAEALAWLRRASLLDACRPHLLEVLLRLPRLGRPAPGEAAGLALAWLRAAPGHDTRMPRVLSALLDNARFTGAAPDEAVVETRRWLTAHPDAPGTPWVLGAALRHGDRADPGGFFRENVVAWLQAHPASRRLPYVLFELMRRDDFDAACRRRLLRELLRRVLGKPVTPHATYVLRTVLECPAVDRDQAETAMGEVLTVAVNEPSHPAAATLISAMLSCAAIHRHGEVLVDETMRWLAAQRGHPGAAAVVPGLLGLIASAEVGAARGDDVVALVLDLAHDQPGDERVQRVLGSVLHHPGLRPERSRPVVRRVAAWLAANPGHSAVPEALIVLLNGPPGPDRAPVAAALSWLAGHPDERPVRRLLQSLVATAGLDAASARDITRAALSPLAEQPGRENPTFLLRVLLRDIHPGAAAAAVTDELLAWLGGHPDGRAVPELLRLLSESTWLGSAPCEEAAGGVIGWLATGGSSAVVPDLVVVLLATKMRLPAATRAHAAALAVRRVDGRPGGAAALRLLRSVLECADTRAEDARRAVSHAVSRLRQNPVRDATGLFSMLINGPGVPAEESGRVIVEALDWLDAHPTEPATGLLCTLTACRRLPDRHAGRVTAAILERLERFPAENPGLVLAMASAAAFEPAALDRLGRTVVSWLTGNLGHPLAPRVLEALARRAVDERLVHALREWLSEHQAHEAMPNLLRGLAATVLGDHVAGLAAAWIDGHDGHPATPDLLRAVIAGRKASPAAAERAAGAALAWARRHPSDSGTPRLIRCVVANSSAMADQAARSAVDWADEHPNDPEAPKLLRCVAAADGVSPATADMAAKAALDWADRHPADPEVPGLLRKLSRNARIGTTYADRAVEALLDREVVLTELLRFLTVATQASPAVADRAATTALDHLAANRGDPSAPDVLRLVAGAVRVSPAIVARAACAALEWAERNGGDRATPILLGAFVTRRGLPPEVAERIEDAALSWQAGNERCAAAIPLLRDLIRTGGRRAADIALRAPCLGADLLGALVGGVGDGWLPAAEVVPAALGWLASNGESADAPKLFARLLRVDPEGAAGSAAVRWVAARTADPAAAEPLAGLLLTPGARTLFPALSHAGSWLAHCGSAAQAGNVVNALLRMPAARNFGVDMAAQWLAAHPGHAAFAEVAARLLDAADVPDQRWQDVTVAALAWLDARPADATGVPQLCCALLRCTRWAPHIADRTAEAALAWLGLPGGGEQPRAAVVLSLLCALGLTESLEAQVVLTTLSWLETIDVPEEGVVPGNLDRRTLAGYLATDLAARFPPAALAFALPEPSVV